MTKPKKEPPPKAKRVRINCTYFRDNGDYFGEGQDLYGAEVFLGCLRPRDFGNRLRALEQLPGLFSGVWRGPFLVKVSCGVYIDHPELVL